jgi:hypothetical protein
MSPRLPVLFLALALVAGFAKTAAADEADGPPLGGPASTELDKETSYLIAGVAFAISGVHLAIGVGTGVRAFDLWDEAKTYCAAPDTPAGSLGCTPKGQEIYDEAAIFGDVTTAGFVIAGMAAVIGIAVLPFPSEQPVRVGVGPGPGMGLSVFGEF